MINSSLPGQNYCNFSDDVFSWMKSFVYKFKFNWSLFLSVQLTIMGWGNGLAPSRWQAITWTNVDLVPWRIHAALGGDELRSTVLYDFIWPKWLNVQLFTFWLVELGYFVIVVVTFSHVGGSFYLLNYHHREYLIIQSIQIVGCVLHVNNVSCAITNCGQRLQFSSTNSSLSLAEKNIIKKWLFLSLDLFFKILLFQVLDRMWLYYSHGIN